MSMRAGQGFNHAIKMGLRGGINGVGQNLLHYISCHLDWRSVC
jgi:hypothetical protein